MSTKPRVVSLFTGVGGIDVGFHNEGFETVFASDIWEKSCESFRVNFPGSEVQSGNIADLDFSAISKKHGNIDVVVGGPPCPAFSKSRFYRTEKNRGLDDEHGLLTVTNYFRAIEELNPTVFFFENVHGFIFKPHKSALEFVKSESERLGFKVSYQVMNAADYGVPQTRQRFICIGVREELADFEFPSQTHSNPEKLIEGTLAWTTCGEILSSIDYPLPEDEKMVAGSKDRDLLKLVPPGDNYLFFTQERGHPNPIFKWRSRYWSFLLKLSPDRPSWTIQASQSNNMGPFHWKNRFLRIQEIKRIQSFSDDYTILGSYKEQWRQVGNAVPPLLAQVVAKEIKNQYFNS